MNLPKVTIQLVTYNSRRYLPDCLQSIFSQTCRDFQVLIMDNDSLDGTADYLRKNYPEAAVFRNKKNLGFARANNQGIRLLNSPFVVLCNPDIVLEPDWLEKIMAKAENDDYLEYGSFGGRLLKLEIGDYETGETKKTDIVDSCGLQVLKSHRIVERGAGRDKNEFNLEEEVFGLSGALVLYRREALQDVLLKTKKNPEGECFDEDFFFYKEDADLAWRLRLRGWKSLFSPEAEAYHARTMVEAKGRSWRQIVKSKKEQSSLAKYYSFRNHAWILIKNEFLKNLAKCFFPIFFFELKRFFYALFWDWSLVRAGLASMAGWPKMLEKRRIILKRAKATSLEISRWFS